MRNQAHSTVYKRPHQSRFTALMCLLLCVTLNVQWLASTATWTQRNPVTVPQQNALYIPTTQTARTPAPAIGTITQVNPPAGSTTLAIRTVQPNTAVPNNALFKVNTNPGNHALIETDPRFADYKTWINSDVLIQALGQQPNNVLQRLGDGFYEQKLVQEQIIAATGQRYAGDYTSNEAQYKALLLSGAEFANNNKGLNLSLGVALTEAQMRNLTTDIVWLVEQTITLPNGQTTQALVPQVYLRVKEGDLKGDGSLIAARDINLNLSGDLNNSGTIAGRNSTFISAENINNQAKDPNSRDAANATALGGRITGNVMSLTAKQDPSTGSGGTINNLGGQILGTQADGQSASQAYLSAGRDINVGTTTQSSSGDTRNAQGVGTLNTRTVIDQVGTIQAGNVAMFAGRDLTIAGASVSATSGNLILSADRNVKLATVQTAEQTNINFGSNRAGGNILNQGSTTQVGSQLGAAGQVYISAGRQAIEAIEAKAATYNADGSLNTAATLAQAAQARTLGNVSSTGATIQAGGLVTINATGNIELLAAKNTSNFAQETSSYSKGFLSKSSSNTKTATQTTESQGTTISGGAISMNAGIGAPRDTTGATGNITAQGVNLVADGDISIRAANNVTLTTAQNTFDSQSSSQTKKSGFSGSISPSGMSVGYSKSNTATTGNSSEVTNTGTSIGSIGGNITIQAGNALKVEGSTITAAAGLAGAPTANTSNNTNNSNNTSATTPDSASKTTPSAGQVTLSGASVAILDVQNTASSSSTYDNKTSGITVGVSIGALGAITGVQSAAKNLATVSGSSSGSSSTDARMQAMGAAVAANTAYNAAKSITSGGAFTPSITVGISTSKTHNDSQTNSSTSQGSSITGTNVSVSATGKDLDGNSVGNAASKDNSPGGNPASGNLLVQGSKVAGTAATSIAATGDIDLLAGKSTSSTTTNNASKSAGASVSFSMTGVPTGGGVNASKSNGNSNEQSTTYTNTQIGAGTGNGSNPNSTNNSTLTITSGGNPSSSSGQATSQGNVTMTGAVLSANQVAADIKGNLSISSVQDTYSYKDSSKSVGASISGGSGGVTGGSVTAGKSNTSATYSAVTEQSGIKAGDGGFQVAVGGQTTLTGAVIASTDKAVNTTVEGKDANGNPQTKPLNQFTSAGGVTATDLTNTSSYKASSASITAGVGSSLSSSGAGIGNAKGNETSTTVSGISGVTVTNSATGAAGTAVNNTVRTDDKAPVLANTFAQNKDAIKSNVAAQVQITQAFGQQASKAIGDLGDKKTAPIDNAKRYLALKEAQDNGAPLSDADKKQLATYESQGTTPATAKAALTDPQNLKDYENWKEGGTLRVLAHTLTGGLTGNLAGAAGAATSQTLVPMLGEQLANTNLPLELKQGLLQIASLAIGTAAGGGNVAGAVAAQNATANNYLSHTELRDQFAKRKLCDADKSSSACKDVAAYDKLSTDRNTTVRAGVDDANPTQATEIQGYLKQTAQDLASYRTELQAQLSNTKDPSLRKELSEQINRVDNNIQQTSNISADYKPATNNFQVTSQTGKATVAIVGGSLYAVAKVGAETVAMAGDALTGSASAVGILPPTPCLSGVCESINKVGVVSTVTNIPTGIVQSVGHTGTAVQKAIADPSDTNLFDASHGATDLGMLATGAASLAKTGVKITANTVAAIETRIATATETATTAQAAAKAEATAAKEARISNNANADNVADPFNIQSPENIAANKSLNTKTAIDEVNGTKSPHYLDKHGANDTTLQQQYDRAMNGTNPQTGLADKFKPDASKFFNATDMEAAIKQAEAAYAKNPSGFTDPKTQKVEVPITFSRPVGEGYMGANSKNTAAGVAGEYRWSNTATVGIDPATGKAYTAYPSMTLGTPKPDPLKMGVAR